MKTLWQKTQKIDDTILKFTTGQDPYWDIFLAPFDVIGSMAHAKMLEKIEVLSSEENEVLQKGLKNIYQKVLAKNFKIEEGVEDIHSQVELNLIKELGDVGKKLHTARSRNDQVLLDLRLFFRSELEKIVAQVNRVFEVLLIQSEKYKNILLPGYTHFQIAMPSSFGLWFSAYAESLKDDMTFLQNAYRFINRNPLGAAAGYGSSFPIDRRLTTELLGFEDLNYNVVYAQMNRGRTELALAQGFAMLASTLNKLASDVCLYTSQNFTFLKLPTKITTGSSIMPHKQNPDVFELIRGRSNQILNLPTRVSQAINNLPSGYHRDFQLLKEEIFPAFQNMEAMLLILDEVLPQMEINENILSEEKYQYLFSVEEVNRKVQEGIPFREAYQIVGKEINEGNLPPIESPKHTHLGSMGDLQLETLHLEMRTIVESFGFDKVEKAIKILTT